MRDVDGCTTTVDIDVDETVLGNYNSGTVCDVGGGTTTIDNDIDGTAVHDYDGGTVCDVDEGTTTVCCDVDGTALGNYDGRRVGNDVEIIGIARVGQIDEIHVDARLEDGIDGVSKHKEFVDSVLFDDEDNYEIINVDGSSTSKYLQYFKIDITYPPTSLTNKYIHPH